MSPLLTTFLNTPTKQANFAHLEGIDRVMVEFEQVSAGTIVLPKTYRVMKITGDDAIQHLESIPSEYLIIKANYNASVEQFTIEFDTANAQHLDGSIKVSGIYAIPNTEIEVTETGSVRTASEILAQEAIVEVANQNAMKGATVAIRGAKDEDELTDDKVLIYKFVQDSTGAYK